MAIFVGSTWAQLPTVCRNICTRLYTKTLASGSHYTAGRKYCRSCEDFSVTSNLFCERCGMRLRASPAAGVYKEKVRAKKKLIAVLEAGEINDLLYWTGYRHQILSISSVVNAWDDYFKMSEWVQERWALIHIALAKIHLLSVLH